MPYAIVERLVQIVEAATDENGNALGRPFTGFTQIPQSTPASNWFIPLQRRMDDEISGGDRHTNRYIYDLRFYLVPLATQSPTQNTIEIDYYLDIFKRTFFERPQLRLNQTSTRLPNIVGNTQYIVTSGIATPMLWPPGLPPTLEGGGTAWWGFIGQLTVDWRERVAPIL
jgi:hypothetical protein